MPISYDDFLAFRTNFDARSLTCVNQMLSVNARHLLLRTNRREVTCCPRVHAGVLTHVIKIDEGQFCLKRLCIFGNSIKNCILKFTDKFKTARPKDVNSLIIYEQVKIIIELEHLVLHHLQRISYQLNKPAFQDTLEVGCSP